MALFFYSAKRKEFSALYDVNECYGFVTSDSAKDAMDEAEKDARYRLGNTKSFVLVAFNKVED